MSSIFKSSFFFCYTYILFQSGQFHEAEISLSEANRINNQNPEVWGYLCLLNMTLRRYDEFIQCYAEMTKVNSCSYIVYFLIYIKHNFIFHYTEYEIF